MNTSYFFFEFSQITLESLVQERLGTNKLFPEEDLMALLKGVTSALAHFQENQITNCDIHPTSIFFDLKSGAFKIYDKELIQGRGCGLVNAAQ